MSKILFLTCFLGLASSLLADVKDVLTKNYESIDLQTDPATRCLYIDASINDTTGSFIIDLRAPGTILSLESLEKFGLEKGDILGQEILSDGSTTEVYKVASDHFILGNLRFKTESLAASNQQESSAAPKGADGRIGGNILNSLKGIIDYPAKRLYYTLKDPETTFDSAMKEVDISAVEMGENGVDRDILAQVNGSDVHLLIDTSAQESLIAKEHLKEFGITAAAPPEGTSLPLVTYLDSLKLGSVTFSKLPLRVISMSERKLDSPVRKIGGIIGSDLLSEAGAVIDYASKTIYFPDIEISGAEISNLPGAFPFDEKIAKRLVSSSQGIFTGTLSASKNLDKIIQVGGVDYLVFGLAFSEKSVIKGESKETQVVKVRFKRELGDKGARKLIEEKFAQENDGWIVFKNRKAILELDQTVFRDSALRRKALETE